MRPPPLRFEPRAVGGRELQRRAVVARRQAAPALRRALQLQLLLGLVAGIEQPLLLEPLGGLGIARQPAGLLQMLVPIEPEPGEILLDPTREFLGRALAVRVVEPEDEGAARLAREQPVGQRGPDVSDMQPPGRARRETDAGGTHGHADLPNRPLRMSTSPRASGERS